MFISLGTRTSGQKMFLIGFWWNSNESCHFIWFHSSSIFIYKINELVMSCQFSVSASFTVMLPRGGHGENNDFYARNCLDLFHRNRNDKSKQTPPHASLKTIFHHSPPRYMYKKKPDGFIWINSPCWIFHAVFFYNMTLIPFRTLFGQVRVFFTKLFSEKVKWNFYSLNIWKVHTTFVYLLTIHVSAKCAFLENGIHWSKQLLKMVNHFEGTLENRTPHPRPILKSWKHRYICLKIGYRVFVVKSAWIPDRMIKTSLI